MTSEEKPDEKRDPALDSHFERLRAEVEANPDSAEAHGRLGNALLKIGRAKSAEGCLLRAVELDPTYFQGWINLGGARFSRLDFEGSLEANGKAVELHPDEVLGHYNQGLSNLYLGRVEPMMLCFRRVLEIEPENPGGHYHLAVGLNALGEVAAAGAFLRRSQELGYSPEPELVRAIDKALGNKEQGGGVLTFEIGNDPDDGVREQT